MRFKDQSDSNTQIRVVTDGIVMRLLMSNKLMNQYKGIIIDEIHERSIFMDLCLMILREKLKNFPETKLILSSATLDPLKFKDYFRNFECGVVKLEN